MNVVWVSYHEGISHVDYFDHGQIRDIVEGRTHRTPGWRKPKELWEFDDVPEGEGAVVVIPARHHCEDIERINKDLAKLPWCLVILTGDEESAFPHNQIIHPNMRLWIMSPTPGLHPPGYYTYLGSGYPQDARELIAREGPHTRTLDWFFAGQITHIRRQRLHRILENLPRGELVATEGFTQGLPRDEFYSTLADCKVAPCPSGPLSVDSFRAYEALEAGCVPVLDARTPDVIMPQHWHMVFDGEPPIPIVQQWDELPGIVRDTVEKWPVQSNRIQAWWSQQKRRWSRRYVADLDAVGAPRDPESLTEKITVLVPTSPVPSHPDPRLTMETLHSIRERLPHSEILVMADGVRDEQEHLRDQYEGYLEQLAWYIRSDLSNVTLFRFENHNHQASMTRQIIEQVDTPLILFCEHDTPLVGEIPWEELCGAVMDGRCDLIRLHHEAEIHPEHRPLMLDPEPTGDPPLVRTAQWSQRPHISSVAFYRQILHTYFGDRARTMIEDVMHGVVQHAWRVDGDLGWYRFRVCVYHPDGDIKRSTHSDAREGEEKYAMKFAYPGAKPDGAPPPT